MRKVVVIFLLTLFVPFRAASAQSLTPTQTENLAAFTRLFGYVRFFHPSDAVESADWERFAAEAIEPVLDAQTPEALVETLTELFAPYAPTVQIYLTDGEAPALPEALTTPTRALTQWVHVPWWNPRANDRAIIGGERVQIELVDGVIPETHAFLIPIGDDARVDVPVHDPAQPYRVELGAGVSASIPLALYIEDGAALPATTAPEFDALTLDLLTPRLADRLAGVALAWTHFQHMFVYWDVVEAQGIDWDDALPEALMNAAEGQTALDYYNTLRRLSDRLRDGHTTVSVPQAVTRLDEWRRNYILPFTWERVEGQITLLSVLDGAPESLQPGDVITEVDGRPMEEHLAELDTLTSPVGQFGEYFMLLELASSPSDAPRTLTVAPISGAEPYTLDITPITLSNRSAIDFREPRPDPIAELGDGIVYVDLTRLDESAYERLIDRLNTASGIVFDMRGYPRNILPIRLLGHLTDEPLTTAPFWVPVVTLPDHQAIHYYDATSVWAQPSIPRLTDNIAFIINGNGAVSYAESIMGIIEGYGIGERVGTPTAGANGENVLLRLPGGYGITWTSLRVNKFDGSPLFTVGVLPTIPAERTREGVAAGRDELLEAAFRAVGGTTLAVAPLTLDEDTAAPAAAEVQLTPYVSETGSFSILVPQSWEQFPNRDAFSPDGGTTLFSITLDSRPQTEILTQITAGSGVSIETLPTQDIGGRTWSLYAGELDMIVYTFAMTEIDGTTYIVAVASADSEAEPLRRLFPEVLASFKLTE